MRYAMGKKWTPEDEERLAEWWGTYSIPKIAKRLRRTEDAVIVRARRLQLGAHLDSSDRIQFVKLYEAVTGSRYGYEYAQKSWIQNRGLPVKRQRVLKSSFLMVDLNDFWDWAEKNRSFLDFSKMQPLALGKEPAWVAEQRHLDFEQSRVNKTLWTKAEDEKLIQLIRENRYSKRELCRMMNRTDNAINRRLFDLGVSERPRREPVVRWTDEMYQLLADGIRRGESYSVISGRLGISEKAVRGKAREAYYTEKMDRIRAMIGNGRWGDGAPPLTVEVALKLSTPHRRDAKKELGKLSCCLQTLLDARRAEVSDQWQRTMCRHWEPGSGCQLGGKDCDICADFVRR